MLVLKSFLGGKIRCSKAAQMNVMLVFLVVGGRHKIRKMLFCLAEAVGERLLQHLGSARSLTFHSDASKNRLLLLL